MTIAALIARYGLVAIFAGAGLEGEAVVLTGGVIAHRGLVPLWAAMAAAATGSCLVDQIWFLIGRRARDVGWVRRTMARTAFARALALLERRPIAFIFGFRFIYGLRTVSPIAIGTSRVPARLFVPLNMLAAAIWGPLFTLIGFVFGSAADAVLHRVQADAAFVAIGLILLVALSWAIVRIVRPRSARSG